jgi:hypothetical protein
MLALNVPIKLVTSERSMAMWTHINRTSLLIFCKSEEIFWLNKVWKQIHLFFDWSSKYLCLFNYLSIQKLIAFDCFINVSYVWMVQIILCKPNLLRTRCLHSELPLWFLIKSEVKGTLNMLFDTLSQYTPCPFCFCNHMVILSFLRVLVKLIHASFM